MAEGERSRSLRLETGKIPPALLRDHVLQRRGTRRREVLVSAELGEDAAVFDFGGDLVAAAVDPITGADSEAGWLAVHVSCNDVAAHGARPVAVLLSLLLPEGSGPETLAEIMNSADRAAQELEIEIAGGHSEVTPGIRMPIVTATAIGRVAKHRLVRSAGLTPGDRIWMSKTAGLEGTAILAQDFRRTLRQRLGEALLEEAVALGNQISIVPEAMAAVEAGASALHDVTEGGVLGALWEMAEAAGLGLEVWPDRIPVAPATEAICRELGADPLTLISSGVLLIGAPEGVNPAASAPGLVMTPIARALPLGEGRWQVTATGRWPLHPPKSDALWRIKAEYGAEYGSKDGADGDDLEHDEPERERLNGGDSA